MDVETDHTNADNSPQDHNKRQQMSDVAAARSIIDEIWPLDVFPRKRVIGSAYEAIKRVERSLPTDTRRERKRAWTPRRVQAIVDQEAARIDHFEMLDLEQMAIEEARNALKRSKARASRLEAFLARAAARPHREMADR